MDRRELIKSISILTGATFIGGELFLSGCKAGESKAGGTASAVALFPLSAENISLIDEIGETIIPKTDSPGAKDAQVGQFMNTYVADCFDADQQKIFLNGLADIQKQANAKYKSDFEKLTSEQKLSLLNDLDKAARQQLESAHKSQAADTSAAKKQGPMSPPYFTMLKQLTLFGFFTSKPGATGALRYVEIPGKFQGCIDYKKGDKAWATS